MWYVKKFPLFPVKADNYSVTLLTWKHDKKCLTYLCVTEITNNPEEVKIFDR